ncbi:unnamed protein product [Coregonus sp. 'balchen']|nr:unnamed protein product [Coregonus sp. 'balchen']
MHYPPIGDIHTLLHKALFLRDPKNNPRPANYQFQQNLDYYKTRGADLVNNTRASAKTAPLNINKVSSSLLNFGRKLIAPAMSAGGASGISPINSEVLSAPSPLTAAPRSQAEPLSSGHAPLQTRTHSQSQHHRLLKSESMPVYLSKGQTSRTVSSSPSIESLSGGQGHTTASPPLPVSRGSKIQESLLEAEENEEITIADHHYDNAAAIAQQQHANSHHEDQPYLATPQRGDGEQEEEEREHTPPEQQGKNWDDYILVSQDGELQPTEGGAERTPPNRQLHSSVTVEPEGVGAFQDPLMAPL